MTATSDVLDAIDALERDDIDDLVEAQMRQTPSGYDYSINQPKCIHCGEYTHTLPIKQRMRELRSLWQSTIEYFEGGEQVSEEAVAALDAYRYDKDDSPIVCPGSEFVGPFATPAQLERNRLAAERRERITEFLAGDPSYERLRDAAEAGMYFGPQETLGHFYAGLPLPDIEADASEWDVSVSFGPFARTPSLWVDLRGSLVAFNDSVHASFAPFLEAINSWPVPDIWSDPVFLRPPRWWRYTNSDPDIEVEIRMEQDARDVGDRLRVVNRLATVSIHHRGTGQRESHELLTDRETGHQVVQRFIDDNRRTLDLFLRDRPTIGEWTPVEADEPAEEPVAPRNRRERRGHREPVAPMWTRQLTRRSART